MDRHMKILTAVVLTAGFLGVARFVATRYGAGTEPDGADGPEAGPEPDREKDNGIYLYRVKVVQRDLDAVNYLHRSGSTTIGFKGTPLLPLAKGEAKVTSERGGIHDRCAFQGLDPGEWIRPRVSDLCVVGDHAGWPAE